MVVKRVLKEVSTRAKLRSLPSKVTISSLTFQKSSPLLGLVHPTNSGEPGIRVVVLVEVVSPTLRLGVVHKAGVHPAVGQAVIVPSVVDTKWSKRVMRCLAF